MQLQGLNLFHMPGLAEGEALATAQALFSQHEYRRRKSLRIIVLRIRSFRSTSVCSFDSVLRKNAKLVQRLLITTKIFSTSAWSFAHQRWCVSLGGASGKYCLPPTSRVRLYIPGWENTLGSFGFPWSSLKSTWKDLFSWESSGSSIGR